MAQRQYDRTEEDLGNVVNLGHVNTRIPDQRLSTLFYITGLGLTRDPYLVTGVTNMWVNVGMSQFHLPTGEPQVLRGITGLVIPDRKGLLDRLAMVKKDLAGTKFDFREANDAVETTCPWGNRLDIHEPDAERFGGIRLGMPYIEFPVPGGTADGIARFYREMLSAIATVEENGHGKRARITVGDRQELVYRETDKPIVPFDNHHIQIYIADFSGPYRKLQERGLISEESNQHQYRFKDIVDLDSGKLLFTLDHEMRSVTHPLFGRPLVNRNPDMNNVNYRPGGNESLAWAM